MVAANVAPNYPDDGDKTHHTRVLGIMVLARLFFKKKIILSITHSITSKETESAFLYQTTTRIWNETVRSQEKGGRTTYSL